MTGPTGRAPVLWGDTMGKYHPHGDSSIYGALVVMAQDFKYGLPLVDGHGNFGSIEGDGAAAMRYTEARLQKITQQAYLADLDKDVVDFIPNFDATEKEPSVLPVKIPNILVNGAEGIAVGMATSIPPHNLGEVIDGVIAYMKDPDITTEEMMEIIPGPDFPTGGIVINKDDLKAIYETGNGKIKLRGKAEIEPMKGGKERIVITEIPYTMIGANIGKFLNDVYSLVETKKTTDIVDISNQSSKEGIRIVIELKKGADVWEFGLESSARAPRWPSPTGMWRAFWPRRGAVPSPPCAAAPWRAAGGCVSGTGLDGVRMTTRLEELLDVVDAVVLCTPNQFHLPYTERAVERGKAVLLEKPLGLQTAPPGQAERLLARRGARVMVAYVYRYTAVVERLRALLRQRMGRVYLAQASQGGTRLADPAVPLEWRMRRSASGSGALGDFGSHLLDLLQYAAGVELAEAAGYGGTSSPPAVRTVRETPVWRTTTPSCSAAGGPVGRCAASPSAG